MKRYFDFAGQVLEAIEFVVEMCAAAALVAIGPLVWSYRLFAADRVGWSVVVAILWLASVFTVAREVQRKAITAVSLGVFLAWLVVLTFVYNLTSAA